MKGHVGGGPGSDGFKASGARLSQAVLYVSLHIHSICDVQERLLEMAAFFSVIPPGRMSNIKLESLILAQNERWRHA